MGSFWKDLEKRIERAGGQLVTRAGETMEIQKQKSQIRMWKKENEEDLIKLGTMVYRQYKGSTVLTEEALGLCDAIQSRKDSIQEYQKQISKCKGRFSCRSCGSKITQEMQYCPHCGIKITEEMKEAAADGTDAIKEKAGQVCNEAAALRKDLSKKAAEKLSDAEETMEAWEKKAEHAARTFENKAEDTARTLKDKVEDTAGTLKDKAEDTARTWEDKLESVSDTIQEKAEEAAKRLRGRD